MGVQPRSPRRGSSPRLRQRLPDLRRHARGQRRLRRCTRKTQAPRRAGDRLRASLPRRLWSCARRIDRLRPCEPLSAASHVGDGPLRGDRLDERSHLRGNPRREGRVLGRRLARRRAGDTAFDLRPARSLELPLAPPMVAASGHAARCATTSTGTASLTMAQARSRRSSRGTDLPANGRGLSHTDSDRAEATWGRVRRADNLRLPQRPVGKGYRLDHVRSRATPRRPC